MNRLPVALATPSLFTYYKKPPDLNGAFVVGISQSGRSPDIVSVLEEGRRQGCPTLAITNEPASPLAKSADYVLDIHAGRETSIAATKTYTGELLAIAILAAAWSGSTRIWKDLKNLGTWLRAVLKSNKLIQHAAEGYRFMTHCVVLGRGFNYSTAFEWALKLKELTYVIAEPYSSADFQHGPIAILERGFPIFAVAPRGKVNKSIITSLEFVKSRFSTDLVVISNERRILGLARTSFSIPQGIPEWLTPMIAIVPAQLFSYYLCQAKGYDPEKPRLLHKVTETR